MQVSERGVELIKQFEGFRAKAYQDIIGVWTIGYGTTRVDGEPVKPHMVCTQEQACYWLEDEANDYISQVEDAITVELNQNQIDAIASFMYNVGIGNFRKSTLLRKINRMDFDGAALEFPKWDMAGGKHVAGLKRRRLQEQALFLEPI